MSDDRWAVLGDALVGVAGTQDGVDALRSLQRDYEANERALRIEMQRADDLERVVFDLHLGSGIGAHYSPSRHEIYGKVVIDAGLLMRVRDPDANDRPCLSKPGQQDQR
jgi:hypothetical protein